MNYWIIKTEPSTYSWDDLRKEQITKWTGVRNFQARNNLKEMNSNDICLFYHSGTEKMIIGKCFVHSNYYQDPTTNDTNWVAVDIKAGEKLKKTVKLEQIKNSPLLSNIGLIKQTRLSVIKITENEYLNIIKLSE